MAKAYDPADLDEDEVKMWDEYITCSAVCVDKVDKSLEWSDLADIVKGDKPPAESCGDYD
jgi:hypothetical protein